MKTKLIPVLALSIMGVFATTSFAQDEVVPASDESVAEEVVSTDKADPRADRAKERFERKDAKKAEIANHKAEMKALKEERAAARAERKEAKKAEWENRKAEKEAQKAEKAAMKEERKANKEHGHNK